MQLELGTYLFPFKLHWVLNGNNTTTKYVLTNLHVHLSAGISLQMHSSTEVYPTHSWNAICKALCERVTITLCANCPLLRYTYIKGHLTKQF